MMFWHLKICVWTGVCLGLHFNIYLDFTEEPITPTDIRFGEWKAKWFLKDEQSFPWQGLIPVVSQGLYIFWAERNHIPVWKRFLFCFLLMSLLLLWRGSECYMTLLEKSTPMYFCTANSPFHCSCFIHTGLLKIIRINTKKELFLFSNYLGI